MPEVRPLILMPSYNTGRILRETVAGALTAGCPFWRISKKETKGSGSSF
ncbi:MAG: hypothetical protein MUC40_04195 [Akkermansiaceae bacterium]|nr:hypothetical protein [Akkermansiaceae bacterium]